MKVNLVWNFKFFVLFFKYVIGRLYKLQYWSVELGTDKETLNFKPSALFL